MTNLPPNQDVAEDPTPPPFAQGTRRQPGPPPRWLNDLAALASARRIVRLHYKRPGEAVPAEYVVEPYRLHRPAAGALLHVWQVAPPPEGGRARWRDFRVDRVVSVADADPGAPPFEPRTPVTLAADVDAALGAPGAPTASGAAENALALIGASPGNLWSDEPIGVVSPAAAYFRQLEGAMLDGQVTPDERTLLQDLARGLAAEQRNAVHARILAAVLNEVAEDGRVSHREEIYLAKVRELLETLGWKA